jgi:phosphoribosylanthranilate isomerase
MTLLVKICGLSTPDALDSALASGADLVGFVFFPPSPRNVEPRQARDLGARVKGRALKVALTVDADDALFEAIMGNLRPDILQLHGHEPPERLAALKRRFGLPVMKAIPVEVHTDLAAVGRYRGIADRFLFDARAPREATRPGGLGKPFDWHLLGNIEAGSNYLLSGGLDAGNVAEALAITGAPGVDVSSGVERRPGEKDPEKIAAFVRAAREAWKSRAGRLPTRGAVQKFS